MLRLLAGLETGVLGAILLLVWFSLDAVYQGQHWYAFPNLWATLFFGQDAFRMRAGWATASGISIHLLLLSLEGAVFGAIWRWSRWFWLTLAAGILWAMLCYWGMNLSLWKNFAPFVPRMMPQPATGLAVLLFGICLSRIPVRAEKLAFQVFGSPAIPIAVPLMQPPPLPPPLPPFEES